jgi:hypothetical protein
MTEKRQLSDPTYTGPGTWDVIHSEALAARTPDEKRWYCRFLHRRCENHRCGKCRTHCLEYLKQNPPESYLEQDMGLFFHSWLFHNDVNKRLGKPAMDWATAVALYSSPDSTVCTMGCDEPVQNEPKAITHMPSVSGIRAVRLSAMSADPQQYSSIPILSPGVLTPSQQSRSLRIVPHNSRMRIAPISNNPDLNINGSVGNLIRSTQPVELYPL